MKATILHNPRCSKSRAVLDMLHTAGVDVEVVHYLEDAPSAERLAALYERAGLSPHEGLRKSEAGADTLAGASPGAVLAAMAANPILIERPLVETEKGVRLGRPPERINEIL